MPSHAKARGSSQVNVNDRSYQRSVLTAAGAGKWADRWYSPGLTWAPLDCDGGIAIAAVLTFDLEPIPF